MTGALPCSLELHPKDFVFLSWCRWAYFPGSGRSCHQLSMQPPHRPLDYCQLEYFNIAMSSDS